jgi:AraC-like DNA-binding protein
LIAFNPDEAHDGHPGDGQGFAYSMLWVEPEVLVQYAGSNAWAHFQQATFHDATLAQEFAQLFHILAQETGQARAQESLHAQEKLGHFLARLTQRHGRVSHGQSLTDAKRHDLAVQKMRDYLQSHFASDVKVQELAYLAGVSRVHATRMFTSAFGIAPHEYLNSARVILAKQMIKQGASLTQAAFDAGFSDQAHMSKRFKRSMGMSPGQYQKILRSQ